MAALYVGTLKSDPDSAASLAFILHMADCMIAHWQNTTCHCVTLSVHSHWFIHAWGKTTTKLHQSNNLFGVKQKRRQTPSQPQLSHMIGLPTCMVWADGFSYKWKTILKMCLHFSGNKVSVKNIWVACLGLGNNKKLQCIVILWWYGATLLLFTKVL